MELLFGIEPGYDSEGLFDKFLLSLTPTFGYTMVAFLISNVATYVAPGLIIPGIGWIVSIGTFLATIAY